MARQQHNAGLHVVTWRDKTDYSDTVTSREIPIAVISLAEKISSNPGKYVWIARSASDEEKVYSCTVSDMECFFKVTLRQSDYGYVFNIGKYDCQKFLKTHPLDMLSIIAEIAISPLPLSINEESRQLTCPHCQGHIFMMWFDKVHIRCVSCKAMFPCIPEYRIHYSNVRRYRGKGHLDYRKEFEERKANEHSTGNPLFEEYIVPILKHPGSYDWKVQKSSDSMIATTKNNGKLVMVYLSGDASKIAVDGKAFRPPAFDPVELRRKIEDSL